MCIKMYSWALDLNQTLPNYTGHQGIICYSFVCLTDKIGELPQTNRTDRVPFLVDMCSHALSTAVLAMQELEGEMKDFNSVLYFLMSVFDGIQHQQMVKGVTPHTDIESEQYQNEHWTIVGVLHGYTDMRTQVRGHSSPISLKGLRALVLPPELYEALYVPQLMALLRQPASPKKNTADTNRGFTTPAAAPGSSAALIRMDKRVTSFAGTHHGSGMDWESEPEHVDKHVSILRIAIMSLSCKSVILFLMKIVLKCCL